MPVAGFSFTKISAERTEGKGAKIDIENNVAVKNMEDMKFPFAKPGDKALKVEFEFTSTFSPDYGKIQLNGEVLFVESEKTAKDLVKEWKKSKKVKQEFLHVILNAVLQRCNVEAILLSREISLPSPIPLPKVNVQ
jgi:hypothetical protein